MPVTPAKRSSASLSLSLPPPFPLQRAALSSGYSSVSTASTTTTTTTASLGSALEAEDVEGVVASYLTFTDALTLALTCKALLEKKHHQRHVRAVVLESAPRTIRFGAGGEEPKKVKSALPPMTPGCFFHQFVTSPTTQRRRASRRGSRSSSSAPAAQPPVMPRLKKLVVALHVSYSGPGSPAWASSLLTPSLLQGFPSFFPTLSTLDLKNCRMGLRGATALARGIKAKGGWPTLKHIHLSGNLFCAQSFRKLAEAMCCDLPALQAEAEEEEEVATASSTHPFLLTSRLLPCLESLNLENNPLGPDALADTYAILPPTLLDLTLRDNDLGDRGVTTLCALLEAGACPLLERLYLSHNDFGPGGLAALGKAMKSGHLSHLKHLELSFNSLLGRRDHVWLMEEDDDEEAGEGNDTGMRAFVGALADGSCPCLEALWLDETELGEKGLLLLARAFKATQCPPLRTLNLTNAGLTDGGLLALGEALHAGPVGASLRDLTLTDSSRKMVGTEATVVFLEKLFSPPSSPSSSTSSPPPACCGELVDLWLDDLPLTDAGVGRVAAAIEGCQGTGVLRCLQTLELRGASLGDKGLACLTAALATQCPRLYRLCLTSTHVSNDGVRALGLRLLEGEEEGFLPALRDVSLFNTRVVRSEKLRRLVAKVARRRPGFHVHCDYEG